MRFFQFWQWIAYYWRAKNIFKTDSGFLYDFCRYTFDRHRKYYAFNTIALYRRTLLEDQTSIEVRDFGAGSQQLATKTRRVADIARVSGISPYWGEVLFRMLDLFQPKRILEVGTSLGLSTAYLYHHDTSARILSLEGCPQTAAYAQRYLSKLRRNPPTVLVGEFDETLPQALAALEQVDFAYIDGNHRLEPTMRYFEQILPYIHDRTVLVFDDIHWSKEMHEAWQRLRSHPRVTAALDLFRFGVLLFRPEFVQRIDVSLIPYRFKPLQIGLTR